MKFWNLTKCRDLNPWSSEHKDYTFANCTTVDDDPYWYVCNLQMKKLTVASGGAHRFKITDNPASTDVTDVCTDGTDIVDSCDVK